MWWLTGIDFSHLALDVDSLYEEADPGIVFKFNYTQNRELYEVAPWRLGRVHENYTEPSAEHLELDNCLNGDYYHSNDDRVLTLCASGKDKTEFQYVDVNAIFCRYVCPTPPGEFVKEGFVRQWSN